MRFSVLVLGSALSALGGCVWSTALPDVPVDPDRELVVRDAPISPRDVFATFESDWDPSRFRFVAMVNRTDLSVMPDRAADGGEGRLVFADVSAPFMLIVEYAQPGTAKEWATRWHAVKTGADAAALAREFGPIAQIRTADARGGAIVFRQYAVSDGKVVLATLRNEPDPTKATTSEVARYMTANADALSAGTAVMPRDWWASSATLGTSSWPKPVEDETCTGCHAKSSTGFQLDPSDGHASEFMPNELQRRIDFMQLTLGLSH